MLTLAPSTAASRHASWRLASGRLDGASFRITRSRPGCKITTTCSGDTDPNSNPFSHASNLFSGFWRLCCCPTVPQSLPALVCSFIFTCIYIYFHVVLPLFYLLRIHTETGNIWTHLLGAWFFIGITVYFFMRQSLEFPLMDKVVFTTFFAAAITCLRWASHPA